MILLLAGRAVGVAAGAVGDGSTARTKCVAVGRGAGAALGAGAVKRDTSRTITHMTKIAASAISPTSSVSHEGSRDCIICVVVAVEGASGLGDADGVITGVTSGGAADCGAGWVCAAAGVADRVN